MKKYKFLILGAGVTGLGAAYRLTQLGITDFCLLERNGHAGGLSASFLDSSGYTWDIGGHVLFSHYPYFDQAVDSAIGTQNWLSHERESWIRIHGRFVPYPFQYNIRYLPPASLRKCLKGVLYPRKFAHEPTNFKEWIEQSFGQGISSEFMFPYNFKVWGYSLDQLAYHWIGERVATIDKKRLLSNVLYNRDDITWGPNNAFRFPLRGGTGAIWEGMADKIGRDKILFGQNVVSLDHQNKTVIIEGGEKVSYEQLISTVPISNLYAADNSLPEELKDNLQKLKYSSTHVVGLGIKGKPSDELRTKCWMYFPEANSPFYRVTVFSNYSFNNVPDITQSYSLMAEVCETAEKPVNPNTVVEETIAGLKNTWLISQDAEILTSWYRRAEYSYPTPSLERNNYVRPAIEHLEQFDIFSRGRFGAWIYEVANQDHCFMQGVEIINRIVSGEKEQTLKLSKLV